MNIQTRILTTTTLAACLLAGTSHRVLALGPGGSGYGTIGSDAYTIKGLGALDGEWDISGAVDAFAGVLNNVTPDGAGHPDATVLSNGSVFLHIVKNDGFLQVHFSGGQYQTPTMGITSNNGAFNSLAPYGSPYNPHSNSTISYWFSLQPSKYWSVSLGEMAPLEGVESGIEFLNQTFFVSELNNLQLASGYGPQLNLFYGPATFNLQYSDAYQTHRLNILQASLTYNLNADGSDFLLGFGHMNTGHTGNPGRNHAGVGLGFSEANGSLVGIGATWIFGPWSVMPEAEYQWLPKSSVSGSGGNPKPLTTYYNAGAMVDVTYALTPEWSVTGQVQYAYQNGDKNDPNAGLFGNWLQYDSAPAPGTFSPGTGMAGLQGNVTWQHQNFFVRPTAAFTHLTAFAHGTGYGLRGQAADQFAGVIEAGYLLGKYPS